MLLEGPPGLGKLRFAQRAAAALLCEASAEPAERPCGECRSCLLVAAGSHPDRLTLAPEEERSVIPVSQVRERIAELSLTPHYASRRVILVNPADALNRHAANTLLKTLEEPPGGALFILVSARPGSLPATVRSRCIRMRFHAPSRVEGTRWLQEQCEPAMAMDEAQRLLQWCAGAPIAALEAVRGDMMARCEAMVADLAGIVDGTADAVQVAAGWRAQGLSDVLDWQLRIVVQAMTMSALGDGAAPAASMQSICSRLDLRRLDRVCEELLELRSALDRQLNPADQLALEGIAVAWRDAARLRT
jgi:DNA polymerase-3 subunit delta'